LDKEELAKRIPDRRRRFAVEATLQIDGSVLIRAGFESDTGPDMAHLMSPRDGKNVPVLSGTSLGGVIRGQARRIARTVARGDESVPEGEKARREEAALKFVRQMFGHMPVDDDSANEQASGPAASRVQVKERPIVDHVDLVQSRVKIDRFTGGAFESALFTEQPVFGGLARIMWQIDQAMVATEAMDPDFARQETTLRKQFEAEVGLLLLVLKDLWTGFLPIGGEGSVGRGRLQGQSAHLCLTAPDETKEWTIEDQDDRLEITGQSADLLEQFVAAFAERMEGT
jgi:CRISPR/Cas system CSM-associated protein Csm3 (group 7 of RAMP superfamily)